MQSSDPVASSTRRIIVRASLLVAPLALLALATPWILGRMAGAPARTAERPDHPPTEEELSASREADEKLADADRKGWKGSTAIAPRDAQVDASGERVRWFQGFGLSVESTPPGATVIVNGRDMGETPTTTSVSCSPGDEVVVEVRMDGRRPQRRVTRCRQDQLVELTVELP